MNKKILIIFLLLFSFFSFPSQVEAKKKILPIYFYENISKKDFFDSLDIYLQKKKYKISMYYPDLGFIYVDKCDISIDIKQFGNDIYMFVCPKPDKKGQIEDSSSFTEELVKNLKNVSLNSYPIVDDYFYSQMLKDVNQIKQSKNPYIKDDIYNPFVYVISTKRYVGYKKYKESKLEKTKRNIQKKSAEKYYKEKQKLEKKLNKSKNKTKQKGDKNL